METGLEEVDIINIKGTSSRQLKYNEHSEKDSLSLTSGIYKCIKDINNKNSYEIQYMCCNPEKLEKIFGYGPNYVNKFCYLLESGHDKQIDCNSTPEEINSLYEKYMDDKYVDNSDYFEKYIIKKTVSYEELQKDNISKCKKLMKEHNIGSTDKQIDMLSSYLYAKLYYEIDKSVFTKERFNHDKFVEIITDTKNITIQTTIDIIKSLDTIGKQKQLIDSMVEQNIIECNEQLIRYLCVNRYEFYKFVIDKYNIKDSFTRTKEDKQKINNDMNPINGVILCYFMDRLRHNYNHRNIVKKFNLLHTHIIFRHTSLDFNGMLKISVNN